MTEEVLVADVETDGLLADLTKLHMVQIGTLAGDDITIYLDLDDPNNVNFAPVRSHHSEHGLQRPIRPLQEGLERLKAAKTIYGHNFLTFDLEAVNKVFPGTIQRSQVQDTLIFARLLAREFDNTLAAWGRRLGVFKGDFKGPWDTVTSEMVAYAEQDIVVGRAIARHFLAMSSGSERALEIEHAVAYWIGRQERTGFHLDVPEAERMYLELLATKRDLERRVRETFPARWVSLGEVTPRASNSRYGKVKGVPYTAVTYEVFSLSSRQMIGRRLQEAGWKPRDFTAGGQPVVDEETLVALSGRFPAAKLLAEYFEAEKQSAFLASWLAAVKDGKVHGRVNTIGAYTQRMSHSKPNMAQIPKDGDFRKVWKPRPGWKLVGCDGEGIQARVLAHYLHGWDKGRYADIIVNGDKDATPPTDIHSLNAQAIGRLFPEAVDTKNRRDTSKNINYAIYFGAGDPKLAQTLKDGCIRAKVTPPRTPNRELGLAIRRALETNMRGLSACKELVEGIFEKRKFLKGLDGRRLVPSDKAGRPCKRNALVTIIQAGEAIIMKLALGIFADEFAAAAGWQYDLDWAFVANVHDEVQIETIPEIAEAVGKTFARAITEAGVRLGLKCRFDGSYAVGDNWQETH